MVIIKSEVLLIFNVRLLSCQLLLQKLVCLFIYSYWLVITFYIVGATKIQNASVH